MNKVLETIWISTMSGGIGIILIEEPDKTKKAYIGQTLEGNTQDQDVQYIQDWGREITLYQAEIIYNHLKPVLVKMIDLHTGKKVTYLPKNQKGIVKSLSDENHVFVLNCNEDWPRYKDYTGARTNIKYLKLGW